MPGYTHNAKGSAGLTSHYFLAFGECLRVMPKDYMTVKTGSIFLPFRRSSSGRYEFAY